MKEILHFMLPFLDFLRDFDRVNHYKLLYKLCNKGVSMPIFSLIKNLYRNKF